MENQTVKRSAWWFVLPMFLGILGSIIVWAKIRDSNDNELLKWVMIFGAVQTVAIAIGGIYDPSEYVGMSHIDGM